MSGQSRVEEVELAEVTDLIQYGYTAKSAEHLSGPKYLRITDIQNDNVDWESVPHVTIASDDYKRYRLKPGDIVFARSGATVGKSFLIQDDPGKAVFASYLIRVRCTADRVDPKYAALFFQSADYWRQIRDGAAGTGQPNFNGTKLAALRLPIRPLCEQQLIVSRLEKFLARCRKAKAELDRVTDLIRRYKEAVLAAAYRGDLTTEWRTLNHIAPVRGDVTTVDTRVRNLSPLPASWAWSGLSSMACISGGLTKNSQRQALKLKMPYLRVANVYANEIRLEEILKIGCTAAEREKTRLCPGDLLIVEGNGSIEQIGRVALWNGEISECVHQNHIIRVRPGATLRSKYALYWLLSPPARSAIETVASSSSGLHTLSISKVGGLPIPLAPPAEMDIVVSLIEAAFAAVDKAGFEVSRASELLNRLEQATIAKAFRGELTAA